MFPIRQQDIPVSKCPCCLVILDDDTLIAGTYELDSDAGDDHRKGSLCIVRDKQLLLEQDCSDGGVFDLQTLSNPDEDMDNVSQMASPHVLVAHANGCVALYRISDDRREVTTAARFETGSCLLTSLNSVPIRGSLHWVCVGTSEGQVHVLQLRDVSLFQQWASVIENDSGQPVWCVRVIRCDEKILIFTGSDDCSWKVFLMQEHSRDIEPIHVNKDARSGVTSIKLQLKLEPESRRMIGSAMIGSYDENLRSYSVAIDSDNRVEVMKQGTQHVPGSGVWRIRSVSRLGKSILLIAGMYSGIHAFDPELKELESKDWPDARVETSEGKQLIYDVVQMRNGDLIVASFYEKCLHLLYD